MEWASGNPNSIDKYDDYIDISNNNIFKNERNLVSFSFYWLLRPPLWSRVLGYRSGGSGSIPGTTKKKVVGLERGPLSLMSTTEELLDRKVAAPV
jgi:hypothetical protein